MAELNFHHLRYFHVVAHDGNLTRAAQRLNVSQSAVSTQIRQLEDRLGQQLFERRGRSLVLTEAGHITLDHADAIFATGEELLSTLGERAGGRRTVLRVGSLATLSRNFQIRFLRPLLGRDDVEVVVRSGTLRDLLLNLETHQLDVVLSNISPPRDTATRWISHALAEQPISLIGKPDRVRPGSDLKELIETEPLILPTVESSLRSGVDALFDRLDLRPRIAAEVDDMAMIRLLAREGAGLAVVPPIVVKDELENGRLVEAAQLHGLTETFFAVTTSRRFPNPLLRDLIKTSGN
ncbi:LysR family transcriptional regulator [Hwanghaeella grinnelliae]|uniref:LysR family transcriptional regulator n=1 Tax=Hwanghaeella grinnelliae TaxID=2500179 RepID=A0A437QMX4_9PROT|nr:LysR family transcriptional regulator [Hwanghaeella grinnelliae]RVU35770.1 LysR family transcriptional regulator [Hwanghaeella grinnelliae]